MSIRELQGYEITQVISETPTSYTSHATRLDDALPVVIKRLRYDAQFITGTCPIKHEFALGRRLDSPWITRYLELLDADGQVT